METKNLMEIVRRAQSGNHQAKQELYLDGSKSVYYLALKILRNKNNAEDITQDVFISVFEKISELQNPDAYYKWLNRITANKCSDFLRKHRDTMADEDIPDTLELEDEDGETPEALYEDEETRRTILSIVDILPDNQRQCIMYRYFNQFSIEEIAEITRANEHTVKSRLMLARNKMRAAIMEKEEKYGIKLYVIPIMPILMKAFDEFQMPEELTTQMWDNINNIEIASGQTNSKLKRMSKVIFTKKTILILVSIFGVLAIILASIAFLPDSPNLPEELSTFTLSQMEGTSTGKPSSSPLPSEEKSTETAENEPSGNLKDETLGPVSSNSSSPARASSGASTSFVASTPSSPAQNNIQALINAAPLTSMTTQNQVLDNKISQIIGSGGSTYDKVVRGYNWLVKNVTYTKGMVMNLTDTVFLPNSHPASYGEYGNFSTEYLMMAHPALIQSKGVCDNYSAAFVLMARKIGLEAYAYTGQVRSKSGGYIGHTWAGIVINGTIYVFDPQVEQDNLGANGAITYSYFGKTVSQVSATYQWDTKSRYSTIFGTANIINYHKKRDGSQLYVINSVDDISRLVTNDPLKMRHGGEFILPGLLSKTNIDAALSKNYNIPVNAEYMSAVSVKQKACDFLLANAVNFQYTSTPVNPSIKPSDLTVTTVHLQLKKYSGFSSTTPGIVMFSAEYCGMSFLDSSTGYTYNLNNGAAWEVFNELLKINR